MREAFSCLAVCRTKVMFCGWCDGGARGSSTAQAKNFANFYSHSENTLHFMLNYILSLPLFLL